MKFISIWIFDYKKHGLVKVVPTKKVEKIKFIRASHKLSMIVFFNFSWTKRWVWKHVLTRWQWNLRKVAYLGKQ